MYLYLYVAPSVFININNNIPIKQIILEYCFPPFYLAWRLFHFISYRVSSLILVLANQKVKNVVLNAKHDE